MTRTINFYAGKNNLTKDLKDATISGDDIREGLTAVVSVKIPRPQFEGQTKTKLGNTESRASSRRSSHKLGPSRADRRLTRS